jgi:hypothetical protein
MADKKDERQELESLNIDDLDIEELERRLELASAGLSLGAEVDCPKLTGCSTYCGTDCYANEVFA